MASPYLTEQAGLIQSPEVVGLERQRKLADLLTSQAFQSPQGQMISGHYVKPATTQQLQPLLSALLATSMNQNIDEKQLAMAQKLKALGGSESADILSTLVGQQGQPESIQQGPTQTGGNIPIQPGIASQAPNPMAALLKAQSAQSPEGKAYVAPLLANVIPKTPESIVEFNAMKDNPAYKAWKDQLTPMQLAQLENEKQHINISKANLAINQQKANQEKVNPQEAGLRTSFFNQAQPHIQISQAYRKIETAPDTAAGDMSKIFGFMKILDPGSTVREGEYASAENARGVPDTVKAQYNKVISGQRLTPKQRTEFTQAAGDLVISQKQQFDTQKKYYSDIATNYSINPENIIYDPYKDLNLRTTPPKAQLTPVNANQQLNIPAAKPKFLGFEQ